MASQEIYDLLIVFDATYSMSHYLKSLQVSLPQIISVSALTNCFSRIGFIAYHDYQCRGEVVEWSGWLDQAAKAKGEAQPNLVEKVNEVRLDGGHDWPEATKSGLATAWKVMREEAKTVIILYTDAAPHTLGNANNRDSCNYKREQKALSKWGDVFGSSSKEFKDWVNACKVFQQKKKAEFYCILVSD